MPIYFANECLSCFTFITFYNLGPILHQVPLEVHATRWSQCFLFMPKVWGYFSSLQYVKKLNATDYSTQSLDLNDFILGFNTIIQA